MQQSDAVRQAMLRFYDRLSASDVASFDDVVAPDAVLIIGTAPGEWVTERDRMRFGFETEGIRLETGGGPVAYEEWSMGWLADEPTFYFPRAGGIPAQSDWEGIRVSPAWRDLAPCPAEQLTFPQLCEGYEALDGHSTIRP